MPRLDDCHEQIVHALEKAGWDVSSSPYVLRVANRRLYIDMYAQARQDERRIIIVEAKCFSDPKDELNELYTAIGQYLVYRSLLDQLGITDYLYLAVPVHAYENVFIPLVMPIMSAFRIKIMVVDLVGEVIERWLE